MSQIYHEDILKIDLKNNGSLHRSFLNRAIGLRDAMANRYGVELYFDGEPVNLDTASCIGLFIPPGGGSPILISGQTYTYCGGNIAYVQLPQACYNVEGQFTLAIKIIEAPITGTMRMIDGTVDNTGATDPVAPTGSVPTYQEVLAVYEQMLEAKAGSVRFDIAQSLSDANKTRARGNIDAASLAQVVRHDAAQSLADGNKGQARTNIEAQKDVGFYIDGQGYLCQRINSDT